MMIPLPERIHQIITGHSGIKASRLCAQLSVEYLHLTTHEIKKTIVIMVVNGELYEIEYTLPDGTNESIILPLGSQFTGCSQVKELR